MSAPVQLYPHKSGDLWAGLSSVAIRVDGVPLDLTGAVVQMQFKRFPTDAVAALPLTSAGETPGILIAEDATEGTFSVTPRVVGLLPGRYFWDIQVTREGQPVTYAAGTWQITLDVTK
ncbi:hypothetical protein EI77_04297 [Prosthecobacter fusiformis]|uniref:DUF4198 domain-containing protein n=1 Tax=Prosthecobacter fusiformis TaxID=48464 RepID=A0A4R7RL05_9BACT|nr:hypothetical protein [Prosthecobacter fusiformis]TDU64113.1 hypothetical protein EI77_04297 [Prosthecobacter fusiformis]